MITKKITNNALIIAILLSSTVILGAISTIALVLMTSAKNMPPCITNDKAEINNDLILYLKFDKNKKPENLTFACDLSGNNNNAIVYGATWQPHGGINNSGAYTFDGINDFIKVKNSILLSPNNNKLTVSFYVKFANTTFTSNGYSDYINYLGKGSSINGYEWYFRQYNSSNQENRNDRLSFYAFNLSGGLGAGSYVQEKNTPNQWIHLTGVLNQTHVKIYKNGILKSARPLSEYGIKLQPGKSDLHIGTVDGSTYLNGAIDEVKIYKRALTDEQVMQLYLNSRASKEK